MISKFNENSTMRNTLAQSLVITPRRGLTHPTEDSDDLLYLVIDDLLGVLGQYERLLRYS